MKDDREERCTQRKSNVRELENVIERAITLRQGGRITSDDLPLRIRLERSGNGTPPLSADDLADLLCLIADRVVVNQGVIRSIHAVSGGVLLHRRLHVVDVLPPRLRRR